MASSFFPMEKNMVSVYEIPSLSLVDADGDYRPCTNGAIERNGIGTHFLSNGVTYAGDWKNDKMNGQGKGDTSFYNATFKIR